MRTTSRLVSIIIASLCASTLSAQVSTDARSKLAEKSGRILTTVALRAESFRGQPVVILRRPPVNGGDIIIISGPGATPELLASAAFALTATREASGDTASKESMIAISEATGAAPADIRVTTRILNNLRRAPHSNLAGVGDVQLGTIYLPSKAGRDALKKRGRADFSGKNNRP